VIEAVTDGAAVDVILRDGTTLRLRAPGPNDADAVLAFFSGLSEQSLYNRFHGLPRIDRRLVDALLEPDWRERGALIGISRPRVRRGGARGG
jgi:hypothetical protein